MPELSYVAVARRRGVYAILNDFSREAYIGSTMSGLEARREIHRTELNTGRHSNKRLLRSWQQFGPQAFTFLVLETVNASDRIALLQLERYWLDYFQAAGYVILNSHYACKTRLERPIPDAPCLPDAPATTMTHTFFQWERPKARGPRVNSS